MNTHLCMYAYIYIYMYCRNKCPMYLRPAKSEDMSKFVLFPKLAVVEGKIFFQKVRGIASDLQFFGTQICCKRLQRPSRTLASNTLQHTATHYNTLQHTTTNYNTQQHTATHCITQQHTAIHCNTLQYTAIHCNTLQHTATHCNTQQY